MSDATWQRGVWALVLSLGGVCLAVALGSIARLLGYNADVPAYLLFFAFQIGAFVLGMSARRESLGKTASITSAVLGVLSLLVIP